MNYYDLEREWNRQGNLRTLRRMPPHIRLTDPDATLIAARSLVWLAVKTVVGVLAAAVLYAVVQ